MKCYIGREVEWDPAHESVVIYNIGNGTRSGSFRWSDAYLVAYRNRYGCDASPFLDTCDRVDNERAISILQTLGFQRAAHSDCVLTALVVNKDLAKHGLVVERYSDGTEYAYIDENTYVVNKMLKMTSSIADRTPSQVAHHLLCQCRELMQKTHTRHMSTVSIVID